MICLGNKQIFLSLLRLYPSTEFLTLVDHNGYSISSKGFLATEVVDIMKRRHNVAAKSKVYLALYRK